MSPFLPFLAIFLLAINATNGQSTVQDKIVENKNRLNVFIDCYVKHIQEKISNTPAHVSGALLEIASNDEISTTLLNNALFEKISEAKTALHDNLNKSGLTAKKNCSDTFVAYQKKGFFILEKTASCLKKEVDKSKQEVQKIKDNIGTLSQSLIAFKEKSEACTTNASLPENEKLECVDNVSKEFSFFLMNDMNKGYKKLFDLQEELSKQSPKLNNCEVSTGWAELIKRNIAEEIKTCFNSS